ncbi:MAG: helix-turn-helix transcriptional regulator [Clostridia bacterium]|nr:helix-turn-helix transcriptional regulator [Clostridia bacterium]
METFGEFLKKERQAYQMTQQELARELNVDRSLVSQWERGICEPNLCSLRGLCVALNLTGDEVLQVDVEKRRQIAQERIKKNIA